jgi:hypothetical protein
MHYDNVKTTIINLYGGPAAGKSTSAAYFYYLLKSEGKNVELVREYVKDWAWEKRSISTYDQIYFLGKQVRRESLLYGKVKWIVTDSPVMMNLYYAQRYCPQILGEGVRAATLSFYRQAADDGHKHIHVFLKRNKPYMSEGRYQTEAEAKEIDTGIKHVLDGFKLPVIECASDESDLLKIYNQIKAENPEF